MSTSIRCRVDRTARGLRSCWFLSSRCIHHSGRPRSRVWLGIRAHASVECYSREWCIAPVIRRFVLRSVALRQDNHRFLHLRHEREVAHCHRMKTRRRHRRRCQYRTRVRNGRISWARRYGKRWQQTHRAWTGHCAAFRQWTMACTGISTLDGLLQEQIQPFDPG
jgi:hypothetical protein